MAFLYPWGNTQQLNLDWILQKIKELEYPIKELDEVANALISATYARQAYDRSDIVFYDGKLYRANQAIPAPGEVWTPAHWDEILLGDTVSNLVQYVAALSNDQIVNSSSVSGTHTSDALNTLKNAIDNMTLDSDSVSNESGVTGDNVTDALDTLRSAINTEATTRESADDVILSAIAYFEETNTASRTYAVGDYVYIKQYERLYRINTATPSGTTLVGHITYISNGGFNDLKTDSGTGYCKMPDGTLIQWGFLQNVEPQSTSGTATGSLYYYEFVYNYDFPIPFVGFPIVSFTKTGGKTGAPGWSSFNNTRITEVDILTGFDTFTGSFGLVLGYLAIGRWY